MATEPELPPIVEEVTRHYLTVADEEVPGLVDGLYLIGSVALDDFRPGASDIDFVAVTKTPADAGAMAALRRLHRRVRAGHRRPGLDGIYVTWDDLAADPRTVPPGPRVHGGRVGGPSMAGRHPVAWQEMAGYAHAFRGPERGEFAVWTDAKALREFTLANLDGYWRRWHRRHGSPLTPWGLAALGTWVPAWGVLGVSRLRYLLDTGQITSKEGAGVYARAHLDARWHPIIDECLRIRRDEPGPARLSAAQRRRDALSYVATMIAETGRSSA
uniref:Putative nucleotidyltransferase n=1 Tax=Sphaerisporangium sp. SANK 60911 TaxID=1354075 RepID=V5YSD4_9ACTN|nr:putative nucleotidyltransferase [Sphaerisporangium sp. SANK 60911]